MPLFAEFKLIAGQAPLVVVKVTEKDHVSRVVGQLVVIIANIQNFLVHQLLVLAHPEGQVMLVDHLRR